VVHTRVKVNTVRFKKATLAAVARWAARLMGAFLVGLVLLLAIGEGPPNPLALTGREQALTVAFVASLAGMVLLWWRELAGGLLALGGVAGFYVIYYVTSNGWPRGWVFPLFFLPGLLALVAWRLQGK